MEYNEKLISLKGPFLHLVIDERAGFFTDARHWFFYRKANVIARVIRGWKAITVDDLFNEFAAALQFSYYFGENWAAFDECINDLDWLPADAYILFISDIDKVLSNEPIDFRIFMEILLDAIKEWTEGRTYNPSFPTPPTPFHVVLQCSHDKEKHVLEKLESANVNQFDIVKLSSLNES